MAKVWYFWDLYSLLFSEPKLNVEGHTLTNNGLLLQIVSWMESCLLALIPQLPKRKDIIKIYQQKEQENCE